MSVESACLFPIIVCLYATTCRFFTRTLAQMTLHTSWSLPDALALSSIVILYAFFDHVIVPYLQPLSGIWMNCFLECYLLLIPVLERSSSLVETARVAIGQ